MKTPRRNIIIFIALAISFAVLYLTGLANSRLCQLNNNTEKIIQNLQLRDPVAFWQMAVENADRKALDHCLIHSTFRHLQLKSPNFGVNDRISLDAITGILLFHLQHYENALPYLRHVTTNSTSQTETRRCMIAKAEIYEKLGMIKHYERVTQKLKEDAPAFRDEKSLSLAERIAQRKKQESLEMPYYWAVWLLLIIFPASIIEIERRNWVKKYADRDDLRGPYISFMYSPMGNFLVISSALVLILSGVPQKLALTGKLLFLTLHLAIIWVLCQYPLYLMESQVKNSNHGFISYLMEKFRLFFIRNIAALSAIAAFAIVHLMIVSMPLWVIMRPVHATIIFPVVFCLAMFLIQFLTPYLFLLAPFNKSGGLTGKCFTAPPGLRRGFFELGSISLCNRIISCGGIADLLGTDELNLLLIRSDKKLREGLLFFDFMFKVLLITVVTTALAGDPLSLAGFFAIGPGFYQALVILILLLPGNAIRRHFLKDGQHEIDIELAKQISSENLLHAMEKVNSLNFFPDVIREGDYSDFDLSTIEETRLKLRNADGEYIPATSRPDCGVLISLWRSRLAIDWKMGEDEAIFLTSLDYSVSADNTCEELRNLAFKHARLGAECILKPNDERLEIIDCCQKFSAFSAETPLPQEKICNICSQAMKKISQFGPYSWQNTEKGCVLFREKISIEPEHSLPPAE